MAEFENESQTSTENLSPSYKGSDEDNEWGKKGNNSPC